MAELSGEQRERLKKSDFAYVDKDGGGHLPIHDESHVRNAIARFNQTDFESKAARERAQEDHVGSQAARHRRVADDDKVMKRAALAQALWEGSAK
ncbi:MAG TPA: hypothetical protein VFX49_19190 [Chloroflexota bacterium]|nr:hypothetical protein [Chloroflexota bacterium]